ncbi:hypothetical protein BDN67DRAFT_966178 [Paxillus ammoniavirescens]|nr:hypothetical protein BDN67DRAFT_966178 [Paxillus ammoniavirescens]
MFNLLFSFFSALFLGFSYLVSGAPVQPVELIAFAPTITAPNAGDIWPTNSKQSVCWRTDNVPAQIQNTTVVILLGYSENNSENLDIQHPLASGVPIMDGTVEITVPWNATYRTDYLVALIGDSGDTSDCFTILPNSTASSD